LDTEEEELARLGRRLLKVPREYQPGRRHRALRDWIDAIESTGVFVFQASTVEVSEMRGLALPDQVAPIVVLNAKDVHVARTFTALHEFAHMLLGAEGVSNPDIAREPRHEADRLEALCNATAAEVLVPATWITEALASEAVGLEIDELIERIAGSFRVSREVIARRLRDLGHMSTTAYEERRRRYQQESEAREAREESFPFPPAARSLRDNGRAFARVMLQAYTRELVTATQLSQLLNVRLRHLAKIERAVFPISGTGSAP
jgi:Zn-dependent peptidase ImmA (M78 family)